jgi:hypothetical protein
MTPAELADIGRALYGERWQSALARAIAVSDRTMRYWAAGERPIPEGVAEDIVERAGRDRAKKALDLIADLQREHGAPAEIRLTQGRDAVGKRATRILAEGLKALGVMVEIVTIEGDESNPDARAKAAAARR